MQDAFSRLISATQYSTGSRTASVLQKTGTCLRLGTWEGWASGCLFISSNSIVIITMNICTCQGSRLGPAETNSGLSSRAPCLGTLHLPHVTCLYLPFCGRHNVLSTCSGLGAHGTTSTDLPCLSNCAVWMHQYLLGLDLEVVRTLPTWEACNIAFLDEVLFTVIT